jgi:hypothetical protein
VTTATPTFTRREDVILRQVAGEKLLVPIRGNLADMNAIYALVGTGLHVWEELTEPRTLCDLAASVAERYDVTEAAAQVDLAVFLDELVSRGLITRAG